MEKSWQEHAAPAESVSPHTTTPQVFSDNRTAGKFVSPWGRSDDQHKPNQRTLLLPSGFVGRKMSPSCATGLYTRSGTSAHAAQQQYRQLHT
jgi:hypothetical protein